MTESGVSAQRWQLRGSSKKSDKLGKGRSAIGYPLTITASKEKFPPLLFIQFLVFFLLMGIFCGPVFSATNVSGNLSGHTVWSSSGSPYVGSVKNLSHFVWRLLRS